MWLYNIIGTLGFIFSVYVIAYSICLRQLERRQNYVSHQKREIRSRVYQLAAYLKDTIDVLILQDATYNDPDMISLQRIYSLIEAPYDMSIKEIQNNVDKIDKILDQEHMCSGVKDKIIHELSEVSISCDHVYITRRNTVLYNCAIHKIFYPLKKMIPRQT